MITLLKYMVFIKLRPVRTALQLAKDCTFTTFAAWRRAKL